MRTYRIRQTGVPGSSSVAWMYDGYEDGKCVRNSSKLWRHKSDCERAARKWAGE